MSVCRFVLTKFSKTVLKNAANLDRIAPFSAPMYSSKPPQPVVVEKGLSDIIVPKKSKRPIVPKITLLSGQDDISVTTLEEAQKLAKRRDLKLVKIIDIDTKTQRPVYKLMTATEYNAEEVKQKKEKQKSTAFKGEKLLMLGANITEHDLQTQIKKIQKWIQKDIEVRIVINDSSGGEKAVSCRIIF